MMSLSMKVSQYFLYFFVFSKKSKRFIFIPVTFPFCLDPDLNQIIPDPDSQHCCKFGLSQYVIDVRSRSS